MSGLTNPSPATNLKFDASNNVLASINAQAIDPNTNTLNPYLPTLVSHQTGLSVTATAANTAYNIGTAISITRAGLIKIQMTGHVNATSTGFVQLNLTRGGNVLTYGNMSQSLFTSSTNGSSGTNPSSNIDNLTSNTPLFSVVYWSAVGYNSNNYVVELAVLNGDSLQFVAGNGTAGNITYIDDLEVLLL